MSTGRSIALYCALDARAHQKVFVRAYWPVTIALWPIAPLGHFLRTRGPRGALKYLGHASLAVLFALGGYALGTIVKLPRT